MEAPEVVLHEDAVLLCHFAAVNVEVGSVQVFPAWVAMNCSSQQACDG